MPAFSRSVISPLLVLALAACAGEAPVEETEAAAETVGAEMATSMEIDMAEMEQIRTAYLEAFRTGNWAAAASVFAEDATYITPNLGHVNGPAEIQAGFEQLFGDTPVPLALDAIRNGATDDTAWEIGRYEVGDPVTSSGPYMNVSERQPDGSLKIVASVVGQDPAPAN